MGVAWRDSGHVPYRWRFQPQATKATRLQASGTGVRTDAHAALRGPRAYAPIEQCSPAWSRSAIEHRRERSMTIERPWLAHYPADIPAQIAADHFSSIPAVLQASDRKFPHRPEHGNTTRG